MKVALRCIITSVTQNLEFSTSMYVKLPSKSFNPESGETHMKRYGYVFLSMNKSRFISRRTFFIAGYQEYPKAWAAFISYL